MSVYYEPGGGDKDSNDLIQMRKIEMMRKGVDSKLLDDRNFNEKLKLNPFHSNEKNSSIGSFEKFTKGIGRRLLEKSGWKEGQPIGDPSRNGLIEALDASDGKKPIDKTGFGYLGTRVDRNLMIEKQKQKRERDRRNAPYYIASKYDKNEFESNSDGTLLVRKENPMKYRPENK